MEQINKNRCQHTPKKPKTGHSEFSSESKQPEHPTLSEPKTIKVFIHTIAATRKPHPKDRHIFSTTKHQAKDSAYKSPKCNRLYVVDIKLNKPH
jgi:hypothetical protein